MSGVLWQRTVVLQGKVDVQLLANFQRDLKVEQKDKGSHRLV